MKKLNKAEELRELYYAEDGDGYILIEKKGWTSFYSTEKQWDEQRVWISREELEKLLTEVGQ